MRKKEIRTLVGKYVYEKGLELFSTGGVFEYSAEPYIYGNGMDVIRAVVRGSGIKTYHVELNYDFFGGTVVSAECDCPVFINRQELCPHCAAALLAYAEETCGGEDDDESDEVMDEELDENSGGRTGMKEKLYPTSPVITALINRQTQKKLFPFTESQSLRKVTLKPVLLEDYRGFKVSFAIGITKMYVLKNVWEFAERVDSMARYSYGKQLEFVHTFEAFTKESEKLARFIVRLSKEDGRDPYGYYEVRNLVLSTSELEEFLLCLEGELEAHIYGQKSARWHVEKDSKRKMTLKKEEKGLLLTVEKRKTRAGKDYLICFDEGRIILERIERMEPILDFVENMARVPDGNAFISDKDIPVFCSILLPQLDDFFEISREDFDEKAYRSEAAKFELYLDAPSEGRITCELKAVYGEEKYELSFGSIGDAQIGVRDPVAEGLALTAVSEWFPEQDADGRHLFLEDEELLYRLLTQGIAALQELGDVYVSDSVKRYRVRKMPRVRIGVSFVGDLLQFSLSAEELTREQMAEILSRYDRKKKYFRLKNNEFVNLDEVTIRELSALTNDLALSETMLKKDKISLPAYRIFFLEEMLSGEGGQETLREETYRERIADIKEIMSREYEFPAELANTARDYQKTGFQWMMRLMDCGFGGILADAMGLGKTLQTIAVILRHFQIGTGSEGENKRCLIVTPASLVYNWESEFEHFAPELPVTVVAGNAAQRREQIKNTPKSGKEILITSYDLLKRDLEEYEGKFFFLEIIDEAQMIKNHTTQAARAVKLIRAKHRFALTGTPVENRLSELWSIFDYLMPGFLFSYEKFRSKIEIPILQNEDEEAAARLKRMVRPFILRRLKEEVLKELPEKIEENIFTRLEGEQKELYDAHVQQLRQMLSRQSQEEFKAAKLKVLAELTRLRQICCDPALFYEDYAGGSAKSDLCMELIQNAIEGGHKLLLFSQFTSMLARLSERLKEGEIPFYTITGATPKEERMRLVNAFNENDVPIFCISLKAGGTGLNLASADIVIHYDPWWNLAVQNQATDRAHRIGQKHVVTVYKLIAKGTIEERIVKLQERKKELSDLLFAGNDLNSGTLTKDDLLELLS